MLPLVPGRGYIEGQVNYARDRVFGNDLDRWSTEGLFACNRTAASNSRAGWALGPQPRHDPGDPFLGLGWGASVTTLGRLSLDGEAACCQFRDPDGAALHDGAIDRVTVKPSLARQLAIRAVEEVDTLGNTLDRSLLLARVENHGTAHMAFAKLCYPWRP
ncbi:MAG: hypothetical protein FJ090_05870 [Deltaproteobacteria bacterium]|nr:hypothetical protein [Deltaproteobacteria bacterium]